MLENPRAIFQGFFRDVEDYLYYSTCANGLESRHPDYLKMPIKLVEGNITQMVCPRRDFQETTRLDL